MSLCFVSSAKNDFHYTLFTDDDGRAHATGEELLRNFDEERSTFIMDYGDPRRVFTGHINARVLSSAELAQTMAALTIIVDW